MYIVDISIRTPNHDSDKTILFDSRDLAERQYAELAERMIAKGWKRKASTIRVPGRMVIELRKDDFKVIICGLPADEAVLKVYYKDLPAWAIKLMLELAPN